jgi:hypothetical protein
MAGSNSTFIAHRLGLRWKLLVQKQQKNVRASSIVTNRRKMA